MKLKERIFFEKSLAGRDEVELSRFEAENHSHIKERKRYELIVYTLLSDVVRRDERDRCNDCSRSLIRLKSPVERKSL